MKKKTTILSLIALLFSWTAQAEETQTLIGGKLYTSSFGYANSSYKKDGVQTGGYLYFGYGLFHSLEATVESTEIKMLTATDVTQTDYTLAYSNYSYPSIKLRAGLHSISSSDQYTDGGMVLFGGVNYFIPFQWNAGVDIYQSTYSEYGEPTTEGGSSPGLSFTQITPKLGWSFLDAYLYVETKVNYIMPEAGSDLEKSAYFSVRESLSYYHKQWVFSGNAWFGEQVFAVRGDGFIVINSSEKRQGGWGTSIQYTITPKSSVNFAISQDISEDLVDQETAVSTTLSISGGYTF